MDLLKTPLTDTHKKIGARLAPFAGWEMPIQYQGIIAEHTHTRSEVSLFDICHMGELLVSGKEAAQELGRFVTHDLENIVPGRCSYGFMLTPSGSIQDDLIIYPLEKDQFMLVVNASQKQEDLKHLQENLSSGVRVMDKTMLTGKLDLQGPGSLRVLEEITGQDWRDLGYFRFRKTVLAGLDILVSRTGYTGELGYEIYAPWEGIKDLWDMILKDERVRPAGLGARDTLRLEAGLPLYGQDLDLHHTPAEAGYEFVLKSKARYLGKEKAFQVRNRLTGLVIDGRRTPRKGDMVLTGETMAGTVTSGSFAPSLGYCVALAYINTELLDHLEFSIQRDKVMLQAGKAELPFYKGTARVDTVKWGLDKS
jgi:aminomethyltransferase